MSVLLLAPLLPPLTVRPPCKYNGATRTLTSFLFSFFSSAGGGPQGSEWIARHGEMVEFDRMNVPELRDQLSLLGEDHQGRKAELSTLI